MFFFQRAEMTFYGTFEICRYNIEEVRSCLAITTIDYGWTRIGKFCPVCDKMVFCLCLLLVSSSSIKWDRSCLTFQIVVFFIHFWPPPRHSPKESNSAFKVSTSISKYSPLLRHLLPSSNGDDYMIGPSKWPLGSDLLPQEGVKLTERRFLVNAASETARATMARARKCAKFSFIFTGTKLSILYMLICFKTTSY